MGKEKIKDLAVTLLERVLFMYPTFYVVPGLFVMALAVTLDHYAILATSTTILIGLAGWWYIGQGFWRYEAWRASGPRGTYYNPSGYPSEGAKTYLVWWTFGVFLSMYRVLYHVYCRY